MSGWIKLHRKIIDSDIYQMPPLYLRLFERMIIEANHLDKEIPYKEKGSKIIGKKLIRRGERLTSVRELCKWVSWYERGKLTIPNSKTIQNILDWLEENNMVFIYGEKGNRLETHYKIVNYNDYQDIDIPEVTEKKQRGNSRETVTGDKQEYIKNDKELYIDIVEYLNKQTGKNFSPKTKSTIGKINARLKEDYTLEDFKKVIEIKTKQWLHDKDMNKYLRPETLFGNNFEAYLNEETIPILKSSREYDPYEFIPIIE